jgi:hypothetical protein
MTSLSIDGSEQTKYAETQLFVEKFAYLTQKKRGLLI